MSNKHKSPGENDDVLRLASLSGKSPSRWEALPAAGGDRRYYRLFFEDGATEMGVIADVPGDARAFVELSEVFSHNNVSVPAIIAVSPDYSCYIEQDLGSQSLFDKIRAGADVGHLVEETLRRLVKMQTVPLSEWQACVAYKPFSPRQAMWDLNYFKYEYLKPSGIPFDEEALEDDFEVLAGKLVNLPQELWGFQMRDCQSRNVMLVPDPVFIDYQGGRYGPCIYDAVSFLWQARAGFDNPFRRRMLAVYADAFAQARCISADMVIEQAGLFAFFRTLQVLGAYGFRGLVQKRAHFVESIPGALRNLSDLLRDGAADGLPELSRVCEAVAADTRFAPVSAERLKVRVFSFSYKKGYPDDFSGNGGGFMFDCRGMHNPGRYEEYRSLTGRDKPVIDFLKEKGEADMFAAKALELVSPTVERYLKRGFSSLQIGFGCTGGQHRSVYCAESVGRRLAKDFPEAEVEIIHREQRISEKFN